MEDRVIKFHRHPKFHKPNYIASNLKWKFKDCDLPEMYPGEGQDLFVLSILEGKTEGFYIELGSRDPIEKSNSFVLERYFQWRGISIDIDSKYFDRFNRIRKNKTYLENAVNFKYEISGIVDYLSVDLDGQDTILAVENLLNQDILPRVITFEHDQYKMGPEFKNETREYILSHGYELVANAYDTGAYEDWYAHPDLVNPNRISEMKSDKLISKYDYFFT